MVPVSAAASVRRGFPEKFKPETRTLVSAVTRSTSRTFRTFCGYLPLDIFGPSAGAFDVAVAYREKPAESRVAQALLQRIPYQLFD